jgi:hypothetical protein
MDNYQTLCQTCNIGKSNKSKIDLRKNVKVVDEFPPEREEDQDGEDSTSHEAMNTDICLEPAKPAKSEKRHKPGLPKRPGGVLYTVIETILAMHTEGKKLTRESVHVRVCEKFPNRNVSSMFSTVRAMLPDWLRERGFSFNKNEDGSWVMTSQPKWPVTNGSEP